MSKYHAIRTTIDGITFDSKKEAYRYQELKLLERAGIIHKLERQTEFVLIPKSKNGKPIVYRADFTYTQNGQEIVEDVKSEATKTPVYRLKKRMLAEQGIYIKEV